MTEKFSDYQKRLFRLYSKRKYQEALAIAEEAAKRFPEREGRTVYWRACLLCRLDRPDEGLEVLQEGLKRGHWWFMRQLTEDADLSPIKDRPEFQEIVEECGHRQKAAQAQARPQLKVVEPPGGSTKESPLIVALHWAGGNAEDFADYWQAALEEGWLVALPQSSQICYEDGFWWEDREKDRREVLDAFKQVQQDYAFDSGKVVLAGASQGGTLAIELALGVISCRGFLAVVPGLREGSLERLISLLDAAGKDLRGWIITGEKDCCVNLVRRFHGEALKRGLCCELIVEPGMGHEFPEDFDAKLSQALAFLLES
jgi:predicted esterase